MDFERRTVDKRPPVIDEKAFDNAFGRWADELDPFCEGAKVGVMATLMSAFSAYIGKGVRVKTKFGSMPLSAWFVLVGESGLGRKGATARAAVPVIQQAFKAWAARNVVEGQPATGLGMMELLSERDGGPTWVLEEEMDTFIQNAKNDRKVGTYLRKAWDGQAIGHKTSKVDITLEEPHMALVGHVQPKNWGAISGSKDATGGTYNRFLALYVEQSKTVPFFYGPDPTDAIQRVSEDLRSVGTLISEMGSIVTMPEALSQRFEEHHRPICESLTKGNAELSQMCERALAYLVRVSALYALADLREEISEGDLDAALELVRYSVESVRHVLPDMGGESLPQKILSAVQRRHREKGIFPDLPDISLSEVWDEIGRNYKSDQVNAALRELPQITRYEGKSTGGRRPTRLKLNAETDREEVTA